MPRVVITGLGLLTPLGNDVATTWEALCQGKSGAGPITSYDSSRFRVHFGAEIKNFNPSLYMDRKEMRRTDPYEQFAIATSKQALARSGLRITKRTPTTLGYTLVVASEAYRHGMTSSKFSLKKARNALARISPT